MIDKKFRRAVIIRSACIASRFRKIVCRPVAARFGHPCPLCPFVGPRVEVVFAYFGDGVEHFVDVGAFCGGVVKRAQRLKVEGVIVKQASVGDFGFVRASGERAQAKRQNDDCCTFFHVLVSP